MRCRSGHCIVFPACQGQVTTSPSSSPSPSEPPRWAQVLSTAKKLPSILEIALPSIHLGDLSLAWREISYPNHPDIFRHDILP